MERFDYHFEPAYGWMNDPNGVVQFKGKYHAFFQHNPFAPQWDQMYWGHAMSDDLVHWQQTANALQPDMFYENEGGCFSGSAIEKDGVLYLIYTSVSKELKQTQSVAFSRDGLHFEKYQNNPVIRHDPARDDGNFRDPKVFAYDGRYYMVTGACLNDVGRILLFTSEDLLHWDFVDVLFESGNFGGTLECPDFFLLDGKWVLMFSAMKPTVASTVFVIGDFDGKKFTPENLCYNEIGRDFYAPQTLLDDKGRCIMIGWFYHWGKELPEGAETAGALSIPRELHVVDGKIVNFPVEEAQYLLKPEDPHVSVNGTEILIKDGEKVIAAYDTRMVGVEKIESVDILFDKKAVEIFVNRGEATIAQWLI